ALDSTRALFVSTASSVSGDTGPFEIPALFVAASGASGGIERVDVYALDQLDEAWARYEELGLRPSIREALGNSASRSVHIGFDEAWVERDWEAVTSTFSSTHRMDDRRVGFRFTLEGEEF